jgi:hypothetical protein
MDSENDTMEVVVDRCDKLVIKGVEYSLYCRRPTVGLAQLIHDDLVKMGCNSVVRRDNGCFCVWWARL